MIKSFGDSDSASSFQGEVPRRFSLPLGRQALRKLLVLNAAETPDYLCVPPGNHLEALSGKRDGQFSIRINEQWRVCFEWADEEVHGVEIVDYHS